MPRLKIHGNVARSCKKHYSKENCETPARTSIEPRRSFKFPHSLGKPAYIADLQARLKRAEEEGAQALAERNQAVEKAMYAEERAASAEAERDKAKQNAANMAQMIEFLEEIRKSMLALQGNA